MALKILGKGDKVVAADPYAHHLVSKPVVANITVSKKSVGVENQIIAQEEVLNPGVIAPALKLCEITVVGHRTINLGNYESAKIGIELRVPCSKNELADTYQWANTWISARMEETINDAKGTT